MSNKKNNEKYPKPFLKWAGGKKQVIDFIDERLPDEIKQSEVIDCYIEPFLGGGAIFFHLIKEYEINHVYLGDINKELILTYNVVKEHPKELISILKDYSNEFLPLSYEERKDYYYNIRDEFNDNLKNFDYHNLSDEQILRASQMIFLNKTCFNGLYRVNKSGKFNVPMGKYKNPLICDEINIINVHESFEKVDSLVIDDKDYSASKRFINKNSFVYLDPPYLPITKTSFTSYDSTGFGLKEQIELSAYCKFIDDKCAKFILSNSDPNNNFFKDTYGKLGLKKCSHKRVEVRRSINSNGNKRGPIKELLIWNY